MGSMAQRFLVQADVWAIRSGAWLLVSPQSLELRLVLLPFIREKVRRDDVKMVFVERRRGLLGERDAVRARRLPTDGEERGPLRGLFVSTDSGATTALERCGWPVTIEG